MSKYLGETIVDIKDSKFKDYTPSDWAMYFIECYSGIDESHHKDWLIDQVARILKGNEIVVKLAKWEGGKEEYRVSLEEPTEDYNLWVEKMRGEKIDGEYEYDYNTGIAP